MECVDQIIKIENSTNEEEILKCLEVLQSKIKSRIEVINLLSMRKIENEGELKNYIITNTENIIAVFNLIQSLKEELTKSKRNFDSMSNQILILRKKYIEPFEKLKKSITNKNNIDSAISLYEGVKAFKNDIKIIQTHFEKNTLTVSQNNFDLFIKIKRYPLSQFTGVNYVTSELNWFNSNEELIMQKFRDKFVEAIKNQDKRSMLQFFDFYSRMNILVLEIKNFSNKILKELMVETFLQKIVKKDINTISPLDMIYENILRIRKILSEFFLSLENYFHVFNDLGALLKSRYDKKNFILFEKIMQVVSH
ncbi:MAG: hypothetical protein MJ252_02010 [archaeon]|nr:hypothetical protein [archaeon]